MHQQVPFAVVFCGSDATVVGVTVDHEDDDEENENEPQLPL